MATTLRVAHRRPTEQREIIRSTIHSAALDPPGLELLARDSQLLAHALTGWHADLHGDVARTFFPIVDLAIGIAGRLDAAYKADTEGGA